MSENPRGTGVYLGGFIGFFVLGAVGFLIGYFVFDEMMFLILLPIIGVITGALLGAVSGYFIEMSLASTGYLIHRKHQKDEEKKKAQAKLLDDSIGVTSEQAVPVIEKLSLMYEEIPRLIKYLGSEKIVTSKEITKRYEVSSEEVDEILFLLLDEEKIIGYYEPFSGTLTLG
ncbi:MAG: hypothetical protein ACTSO7_15790 [Candidatus Heimdallarchaeota archaeon]